MADQGEEEVHVGDAELLSTQPDAERDRRANYFEYACDETDTIVRYDIEYGTLNVKRQGLSSRVEI